MESTNFWSHRNVGDVVRNPSRLVCRGENWATENYFDVCMCMPTIYNHAYPIGKEP